MTNKELMIRLAEGMDIPVRRVSDAGWILRNAHINNTGHKDLEVLIQVATAVQKEQWDF